MGDRVVGVGENGFELRGFGSVRGCKATVGNCKGTVKNLVRNR